MSKGIPIIANAGVGDTDEIITNSNAGILTQDFTEKEYKKVVEKIDELLKLDKVRIRNGAIEHYSLAKGIQKYVAIYDQVVPNQ